MMLTTQGWFDDVHERERNGGDDDQRRRRARALHDPVVNLLDKKRRMRVLITPEEGKGRAQRHFTDDKSFNDGNGGTEVAARESVAVLVGKGARM
jgi:hypothetical protein